MSKSEKTIQLLMLSLSSDLIKHQDELEVEINSEKSLIKKEKKVLKILGKIIDVESKMNRLQQIIMENTIEEKNG